MTIKSAVRIINNKELLGYLTFHNLYVQICTVFGFRPRYFFTRENKLRLRFLAYIWALVLVFSAFGDNTSGASEKVRFFPADITIAHLDPSYDTVQLGQNDVLGHEIVGTQEIADNTDYIEDTTYFIDDLEIAALHTDERADERPDERDDAAKTKTADIKTTVIKTADIMTDDIAHKVPKEDKLDDAIASTDINKEAIDQDVNKTKAIDSDQNIVKLASASRISLETVKDAIAHKTDTPNDISVDEQDTGFMSAAYHVSGHPVPPRPSFEKSKTAGVKNYKVRKGDTFAKILDNAGVDPSQSYHIIKAMSDKFNPRYLKVGQVIKVEYRNNRLGQHELAKVSLPLDGLRSVAIRQHGFNNFNAEIEELDLTPQLRAQNLTIQSTLYGSARKQGVPQDVVDKVLRIYAWDIDFQRDLRTGDRLEVLYEALVDETGETIAYGKLKYASLSVKGKAIPVYHFKMRDGRSDYFEPNGHSVRKALMMTPIDGGRISSGFGMRHHPILGYSKMHKGVDFAAPIGTPIYAAGDGVVERVGRFGAYGKYIRIRHNGHLKTAYAHLNGYKKGLSRGDEVKQGDVIGYLGNTGRSTGPHLHYEVLLNGQQVNPGDLDLPTGTILTGAELDKFRRQMDQHHENYAVHLDEAKYALASTPN